MLCAVLAVVTTATAQVSRTVMVNSNSGIILYPTNFWTVNALSARSGLSLGTAALSNSSAFQPASSILSNLSIAPVLQVSSGGTGATNVAEVRSNIGLGASWLTNNNVTNFRTAIGLGASNLVYFNQLILSGIAANLIQMRGQGTLGQVGLTILAQNLTTNTEFYNTNVIFYVPTQWGSGATSTSASVTRTNLGLGAAWLTNTNPTNFLTALGLSATVPTNTSVTLLGYDTNNIILGPTNPSLIFTNNIQINSPRLLTANQIDVGTNGHGVSQDTPVFESSETALAVRASNQTVAFFRSSGVTLNRPLNFNNSTNVATTRENIGFSTNLNTLWTATNTNAALVALGIGSSGGFSLSDFILPSTTVRQIFYIMNTNNESFLGLANLTASNNTTVGNETLFRVGLAEQTNRSAQFGFRATRTNNGGEGLAVFSVYGYNALMMIGPSDRSRTNTATNAAIEADIWSVSPTNRVMTLISTNTGAMEMHRPIGFNTNSIAVTAPTNTNVTNPTGWIQFYVGTNSVRVPYYQ
jgi:hypothetical protein